MRKYARRNITPPSGYFYRVPETGAELIAGDHNALVNRVRSHYLANNLLYPDNLSDVIENFLCLRNPESFCQGTFDPGDAQSTMINPTIVREATRMATTRLKWGPDQFLSMPAEAERRASICEKCPDNYQGICTTCNGLKDYVIKAIGTRTTSKDHLLGVCTHCACLLKAKVHISDNALLVVTPPAELTKYPDNCWMRTLKKNKESSPWQTQS